MKYLLAEGNQENMALAKKKKKDFDYMASSILKEHQKHLLASLHFKAVYNHFFFIPSIGITVASGILATLAQSGFYSVSTFTNSIAILAAFSVFWQSLMKQLDYGGRSSQHDSTAMALDKIYKLANLKRREQKINGLGNTFTHSNNKEHAGVCVPATFGAATNDDTSHGSSDPKEGEGASATPTEIHAVGSEDHSTLSRQFEHALQGCDSIIPIKITAAFNALESRINVCNKPGSAMKANISWEKVYPALYDQLTLTIIGSKCWPYVSPGANWAVNKTMKDFKDDGFNNACLLEVLVLRAKGIDEHYHSHSLMVESTPLLNDPTLESA